jgi:TRAP-type C4-dicarboxylate transport system permease small subunit
MFKIMLDGFDRLVCWLIMLAMALMVAVVSVQVLLRYGFNSSIDWADDIGRLLFVTSVFLAVPIAVKHNAHISIGLLVDRLPPAVQNGLARFVALLSAGMMALIGWFTIRVAAGQWSEMLPTVELTIAVFMLPVALGAFHSAVHLLHIVFAGPPVRAELGAE